MMASRGMGAIRKGVVKKRRDNTDFTEYAGGGQVYAEGGQVWDTPNPKAKSKPLTSGKKASAKAAAKAAGRPYPNLIDNMRAARKK